MIEIIALASAFMAVMSFFIFLLALFAVIEVQAFKKSTHQVEYMPIDPTTDNEWATKQEDIEKDLEDYRKELKKDPSMEMFLDNSNDIRSF